MSVFSRLSDIVNSNINAILDKAEDPEKIIRLVIQEMEDTLVEVRSNAAKTIADQKDLARRLASLEHSLQDWQQKAELALSKGREDLARGALVEKSRIASLIDAVEQDRAVLAEAFIVHEGDIERLQAKLQEARAKKLTIDARFKTASHQLRVKRNLYDTRIRDAMERFEKIDARIDRMEGDAEALSLGRGEKDSLSAAFDALAKEDGIEAELEALKKKLAPKTAPKAEK